MNQNIRYCPFDKTELVFYPCNCENTYMAYVPCSCLYLCPKCLREFSKYKLEADLTPTEINNYIETMEE